MKPQVRPLIVPLAVSLAATALAFLPVTTTYSGATDIALRPARLASCPTVYGVKIRLARGSCYEAKILVSNFVEDGDPGGGPGDKAYYLPGTVDWRVKGARHRWFRCNAVSSGKSLPVYAHAKCRRNGSYYYRLTGRIDYD